MIETKPLDRPSPSILKQYVYCPMIPWINATLMIREPVTDSMRIGAEDIEPPDGVGQLHVRTRAGSAIVDEIVDVRGSKMIIEKKKYRSHNYSRYTAQAVGTYIVIRERIQGVRYAKLEIADRQLVLELSEDLVEDIEGLLEKLRDTIVRERPPETKPNPMKCSSCWYKRYCPHW